LYEVKTNGFQEPAPKENKMSFVVKSVSSFAGAIAYLGLAATGASAQQAQFTLPMEAHWGKAVLEPGNYTVKFPNAADATPILWLKGNGKSVNVLLQSRDADERIGENGKLILRDVDGAYVVESISNPISQESYLFAMPKLHESATSAATPRQAARVAVQIKKMGQ
jgi:hypothetical protein